MELLCKALTIALVASLFSLVIEKNEPGIAMVLGLAAVICILALGTSLLAPTLSFLDRIRSAGNGSGMYFSPMLKCFAAAFVTKIGSAVCKDAKQNAAASAVEVIGALAAFSAALPLLEAFLSMLEELV